MSTTQKHQKLKLTKLGQNGRSKNVQFLRLLGSQIEDHYLFTQISNEILKKRKKKVHSYNPFFLN